MECYLHISSASRFGTALMNFFLIINRCVEQLLGHGYISLHMLYKSCSDVIIMLNDNKHIDNTLNETCFCNLPHISTFTVCIFIKFKLIIKQIIQTYGFFFYNFTRINILIKKIMFDLFLKCQIIPHDLQNFSLNSSSRESQHF